MLRQWIVAPRNSIQQTPWEEISVQRLVEFLPASIETLEMTSKYVGTGLSKKDVSVMFMGLPELRYMLPKLLNIKVEWEKNRQSKVEKEGWEEMCLRCKESSVELFYLEE